MTTGTAGIAVVLAALGEQPHQHRIEAQVADAAVASRIRFDTAQEYGSSAGRIYSTGVKWPLSAAEWTPLDSPTDFLPGLTTLFY